MRLALDGRLFESMTTTTNVPDPASSPSSFEISEDAVSIRDGALHVSARAFTSAVFRLAVGMPGSDLEEPSRVILPGPACDASISPLGQEDGAEIAFDGARLRLFSDGARFELATADEIALVGGTAVGGELSSAGRGVELALDLPKEMVCLGLGEKHGRIDKRGRRWQMANAEPIGVGKDKDPLYQSHPFMMGLVDGRAFGIYLDCTAHTWFDIDHSSPGKALIGSPREVAVFYLIAGPDPRDVIERYTELVGRMRLPPRWALGHHQSRWSYASEKKVREIAAGLAHHRIPTDAVHIDIDYMDGYRVFTWDERRFPDPETLIADLKREGLETVTIVDPGVKVDKGYPVYREGRDEGHFLRRKDGSEYQGSVWPGTTAFPDFTREETRSWWAQKHEALLGKGVAGIWNDMNEPAWWIPLPNLNIIRKSKMKPDDVVFEDGGRKTPFHELNNLYGWKEAQATAEAFEKLQPNRRPFILTRSGFSGIQRFAAMWTGDIASRWEDMPGSIRMLLGLGLSGYPFCGADIGGFSHNCTPELYGRWIQLGSVYPFCRTHCMKGMRAQEPWSFGERITAVAREAIGMRYRLMPYLVSLFRRAELRGLPVMAPLLIEFPDDRDAIGCEDQVMVGPDLMAAPVLERGAEGREVYFPGSSWFDLRTCRRFEEGTRQKIDAPLESGLPLFARAGAIIPLWPERDRAAGPLPDRIGLRCFPSSERAGRLDCFDEAGDGFAYLNGEFCEIPYELRAEPGVDGTAEVVTLERGPQRGTLPPAHAHLEVEIVLSSAPARVAATGTAIEGEWCCEDGMLRCTVREPNAPWSLAVELS